MNSVYLETKRTIIRPWNGNDIYDLFEYAREPEVGEMAGWPAHQTINDSKDVIKDFLSNEEVLAIELKSNRKVIGSIGLHDNKLDPLYLSEKQRELGYAMSKEYWGLGLMTEVVEKLLEHFFEKFDLDLIWCGHFITNKRSQRVIEKTGFKFYNKILYDCHLLKTKKESYVYVLTKEDYYKNILKK